MGKGYTGHVEWYVGLQGTTLPEAELKRGMVSSVECNVIRGTIVTLEHRHTSNSHTADFIDSWNCRRVRD